MKQSSISSVLLYISLILAVYTLLQIGFSEYGMLVTAEQEQVLSEELKGRDALKRDNEALYQKSIGVSHESQMTSVMNAIGYSRENEKIYIFEKELTPDIPVREQEKMYSDPSFLTRVARFLGRPAVSALTAVFVGMVLLILRNVLRVRRKKEV